MNKILTQGKALLEKELRRLGISESEVNLVGLFPEYRVIEDLYVALGCGDISLGRIINKLSEINRDKDPLLVVKPATETENDKDAVTVYGLRGILTNIARCCNPAPGDEIVGYITRGRGVTIHRKDCPNMLRIGDNERLIRVTWGQPQKTYPVSIEVRAYDRQGLMGDISSILSNEESI